MLLMFSILNSCSSKENKNELKNNITEKTVFNWVSENYLDCMKNNLPNGCNQISEFPIIRYEKGDTKIIFINNTDEIEYLNVKIKNNIYFIYAEENSEKPFCKFTIENEKMILLKDEKKVQYRNSPFLTSEKITDLLGKLNLEILNDWLKNKKFDLYGNLKITDASYFYCNREIGNINLLYSKGSCENMWIVELEKNQIFIYKHLNSCESKKSRFEIKKELIYKIPIN